jgi:hypothetical protein
MHLKNKESEEMHLKNKESKKMHLKNKESEEMPNGGCVGDIMRDFIQILLLLQTLTKFKIEFQRT